MTLSDKTYDVLKFIALIGLPALAVLYLGIGNLWDIPATEEVVATIVLVDTALGTVLQIGATKYNKSNFDGILESTGADPDTGIPDLKMTLTTPPDDLLQAKAVRLKVSK